MKKAIRVLIPLILILAIVVCTGWYLFIYDREFTRDMLLHTARYFEDDGKHSIATWFYNKAYKQSGNSDAVAIELAEQYKLSGNYTKAEYTLSGAIADGGGADVYIALCKTYVEQDKLLDAVNMLNYITNADIKAELDALRPAAPTCSPDPATSGAYYTQYITVTVSAGENTLYVNANGTFPSIYTDRYTQDITLTDGENIIYAVAVADNGLVSPAAIFGFTVGGVIEEVAFTDPAVEAALREALNADDETVLYTNDLWSITEFTVPKQAKDLSDLRHLAFLEKLTLNKTVSGQLTNISGLANLKELYITDTNVSAEELPLIGHLPSLQKLTLSGCSLSTTAGLEFAKGLTYLDLSNNAIRNINPLSSLEKLEDINLSRNALKDLSALAELPALRTLDVSGNNIASLSPITAVAALERLVAGNNTITELTGINKLTKLTYLDLSNNTIIDVSALIGCTELTTLNISANQLTDISHLAALNKLATLNFSNNKVTEIPQWSTDCALVNIDGSYNLIDTLKPLSGLKMLNNVFMDYNEGITMVNALASCPVLIQVNVYGTGVTDVSSLTEQSIVVNYDPTK